MFWVMSIDHRYRSSIHLDARSRSDLISQSLKSKEMGISIRTSFFFRQRAVPIQRDNASDWNRTCFLDGPHQATKKLSPLLIRPILEFFLPGSQLHHVERLR